MENKHKWSWFLHPRYYILQTQGHEKAQEVLSNYQEQLETSETICFTYKLMI